MSRTKSSVQNVITGTLGQISGIAAGLAVRTVFIKCLSEEYLGLNGLFTNILTIFSLVELGVGPAINFSLYKPLTEKNIPKIKSLMQLYKRAYMLIGFFIAAISLLFTPFYTLLMDNVPDIPNLNLIYWLFALNTVISYFFSYKRALVICDEKRYIDTNYHHAFNLIKSVLQIIFLYATKNYILFLSLQVAATFAENIGLSQKADKMYPYLKEKNIEPISKETTAEIKKNIGAMLIHKIGDMVVFSSDNIILSKFVGFVSVGLYSNYYLIIDSLNQVIIQIFASVTAGVGNLNASENEKEKLEDVLNKIFFLNFWIYGFCSCCLWVLFNPFISVWIGDNFIFDDLTVMIIVISFYLTGMRKSVQTFREATGSFYYDRYKPVIESVINIAVSIFLAKKIGAAGVFLGTIISTVTTCIWIEPYVLYKYVFKKSARSYAVNFIIYTLISIAAAVITSFAAGLVKVESAFAAFIIKIIICAVVPNLVFLLCYFKTDRFGYFLSLVIKVFKKILFSAKK